MENTPLVSVIIPVYNVENYLRECVDSVINQTYKNLEIILVDDGSTDSSGNICDEYAQTDGRIKVVHQKNAGPSKTRNTGIRNAGGKFIYFLDSDDYIDCDTFEILVSTAETQNADVLFFAAHSFSDDGADIKQGYEIKGDYETKIGYEILTELQRNKDYHCAIYLLFIRRSLLIDNQISFLESAYCSEDMLFTYQLFCSARTAAYCKITPYHRRYHAGSIVTSAKSHRHFRSCRDVYCKIRDYSETISIISDRTAREYIARCAFNVFNVYEKLSKADKKDCKKELREFRNDVLENNAFGNTALKMRCYGKAFWFIYKIYEKTVGRLLKGKK